MAQTSRYAGWAADHRGRSTRGHGSHPLGPRIFRGEVAHRARGPLPSAPLVDLEYPVRGSAAASQSRRGRPSPWRQQSPTTNDPLASCRAPDTPPRPSGSPACPPRLGRCRGRCPRGLETDTGAPPEDDGRRPVVDGGLLRVRRPDCPSDPRGRQGVAHPEAGNQRRARGQRPMSLQWVGAGELGGVGGLEAGGMVSLRVAEAGS